MFLFVYGTLKKGFSNHSLLGDSAFIESVQTTEDYSLMNLGGFPGLIEKKSKNGVSGEIYEISDKVLKRLDIFEGVDYGLFNRKVVKLKENSVKEDVFCYFFGDPTRYSDRLIESGIFEEKRNAKNRN